jgi:uncharacterized protein
MFRTPNEESNAVTVKLQVFFPTDHPLLDVLVEPHPGWSFTAKSAQLANPVTTDDGKITDAVSEVTWTADSKATGLQAGEATDFVVIAGQLPDAATATFRALQTYSNGDVIKWIETQTPGADEPEHPAPVLTLSPASGAAASASATGTTAGSSSSASSSKENISLGLAVAALVVALAGAGLAVWRRRSQP